VYGSVYWAQVGYIMVGIINHYLGIIAYDRKSIMHEKLVASFKI